MVVALAVALDDNEGSGLRLAAIQLIVALKVLVGVGDPLDVMLGLPLDVAVELLVPEELAVFVAVAEPEEVAEGLGSALG